MNGKKKRLAEWSRQVQRVVDRSLGKRRGVPATLQVVQVVVQTAAGACVGEQICVRHDSEA